MAKNQIPFFASANDTMVLLESVSATHTLFLVPLGMFDTVAVQTLDVQTLTDDGAQYLIVEQGLAIEARPVSQRGGGVKYAVDQIANPKTVVLHVGSIVRNERLVAGQVGTASNDPQSIALYKLLAKAIQKQFEKIKSFYVGPEASQMLDSGIRLTPTEKSSTIYDLTRS